jgi:ribosomal subunit interface protein
MNIKIKLTNVSASPAIEEFVFKKMRLLEKFIHNGDALCEVELAKKLKHRKSGDMYRAEADITFAGEQFYVAAEKDDIYSAIDEMRVKAERMIVRKKFL